MITTVSAVLFVALVIAMLAGWLNNPYAGLVVFVAIPGAFAIGLLLIPLGMRLQRQKLLRHPTADVDWPVLDFRRAEVRRTSLLLVLTAVNVVIVLLAGYGTLHWMESPSFCGQVCHTPMHPQFTALQNASHARVACVECHIGEGARGFVHAKLWRAATHSRGYQFVSEGGPAWRPNASGRASPDLRQVPPARACCRGSGSAVIARSTAATMKPTRRP